MFRTSCTASDKLQSAAGMVYLQWYTGRQNTKHSIQWDQSSQNVLTFLQIWDVWGAITSCAGCEDREILGRMFSALQTAAFWRDVMSDVASHRCSVPVIPIRYMAVGQGNCSVSHNRICTRLPDNRFTVRYYVLLYYKIIMQYIGQFQDKSPSHVNHTISNFATYWCWGYLRRRFRF